LDCSSGKAGRCGNKGNRENAGGLPQAEERKRLRLHWVVRQELHDPNKFEDSSAAQPAGAWSGDTRGIARRIAADAKFERRRGDIIDPAVAAETGQPGETDTERPEGVKSGGTRRSTNRHGRWTRRCGATRTFPIGRAGRCSTWGCSGRHRKRIWWRFSFGDTRSWAAGDAEGDERRGSPQLNRRQRPEDAVPGDARGHIIGETGQAKPGTLGDAKQGSQKDRSGGSARNLIAGTARRRGLGLPGKRHRRTWVARGFGETRGIKPRSAEGSMQRGNLKHRRWHGLWTEGSGQLETSSPARTNSVGPGKPGQRRRKPSWKRQETGQPGACRKGW